MTDQPKVTAPIETLEYQAQVAAQHRPCAGSPCDSEFIDQPWRWCSGCIIAALLKRIEYFESAIEIVDATLQAEPKVTAESPRDPLAAPCQYCGYSGQNYWQAHTHNRACRWWDVGGERERRAKLAV